VAAGRLAEAEASLRAAADVAPQVQDPTIPNPEKYRLQLYNFTGRFDEALVEVEANRARGAATSLDVMAFDRMWEAIVRGGKGEYQEALALLADALAASERSYGTPGSPTLNTVGWIYGELQNHERALEWNTRALAEDVNADDLECENNTRLNLGDALAALGRLDEAEAQFQVVEQVVRHPRPQDDWMLWRYAQRFFHSYGDLWLLRGDAARALAYADECLQLAEQTGSRKNIVKGRRLRGQALLAQGELAEAEQELARALELAQEVGNPPQLWKTHLALGDLRTAQGRSDVAHASYHAALVVIKGVATGLEDAELRETFLGSAHVQQVRRLIHMD
jgi:tetratricopeptide (TPR) repeat protein